jgi:hypothetical protein
MRVVGHENGEVLRLGNCKVWCFAGLYSVSLAVNIYVNDFPKINNKLPHTILLLMIAVLLSHPLYAYIYCFISEIELHLHLIFKWFQTSYLVLNANQTYPVKFTSSKSLIYPFTAVHVDQILAIAETIKFLGLHLHSPLSWTSHTNTLLKKLNSVCFTMRSSSYILNIDTLRIVEFANFQPLIN